MKTLQRIVLGLFDYISCNPPGMRTENIFNLQHQNPGLFWRRKSEPVLQAEAEYDTNNNILIEILRERPFLTMEELTMANMTSQIDSACVLTIQNEQWFPVFDGTLFCSKNAQGVYWSCNTTGLARSLH